jgi:hypothetical protein
MSACLNERIGSLPSYDARRAQKQLAECRTRLENSAAVPIVDRAAFAFDKKSAAQVPLL